jgi:hypothetical protein
MGPNSGLALNDELEKSKLAAYFELVVLYLAGRTEENRRTISFIRDARRYFLSILTEVDMYLKA